MNRDVPPDDALSDYHEFSPPSPLAGHLLCLWTQTILGSRGEFAQQVFPDACVDIVVVDHQAPVVVGPWTKPFIARFAPGTIIVGARCHPGLASALLGLPASSLLNQSAPLREVWSAGASAWFERIADEQSLSQRKSAMELALLARLAHAAPIDQATSAAIDWLARHPHGRMKQLSQWTGFSSRQLQRRFRAAVGYGPKMFQSVLRFQRVLNLPCRTQAPRNLAHISADAGYSDHAHMTREVQRFSGSPPTVLLRSALSALRLSPLLNPPADPDR